MIAVREGSYKVSEYEVRLRTRIWVMGTVQCALRANVSTTLRESVRNLKVQLEAVALLDIRTRCEGKGRGSPIVNYVLYDLVL